MGRHQTVEFIAEKYDVIHFGKKKGKRHYNFKNNASTVRPGGICTRLWRWQDRSTKQLVKLMKY